MRGPVFKFYIIILLLIASCNTPGDNQLQIHIESHRHYSNLSSASGVSVLDGRIMLIGDDIPWLVYIDADLSVEEQIKLLYNDSVVNGRMRYDTKADFEAMETISDNGTFKTIILPSGSKPVYRDTAIIICHGDSLTLKKKNIRSLLEKIKATAGMQDEEINIEGLAISNERVFLFHRGNISGNFIAELDRSSFLKFLEKEKSYNSDVAIHYFELPQLNGVISGFSGACYDPVNNLLLFTASLENTGSVTADGEVLGSYTGIIPVEGIKTGEFNATFLKIEGKPLRKKMEGISIIASTRDSFKAVMVCDNDDGTSDIYLLQAKY